MHRMIFLAAVFGIIVGCSQPNSGELRLPEGDDQFVVHAGDVDWRSCGPNLPPDCEIAVLEGNPQIEGLFSVRFRLGDTFVMPAHTHPKEERVTILSGNMSVAFGANATREDAKQFGPGDYYVNARDKVHTVWANEASIIQITGIGPWEANFTN